MLKNLIRRFRAGAERAVPGRAKRYSDTSTAARRGPTGEWKPPVYTGPDWIGKPITAPPEPIGPDWIGKGLPQHPVR